MSKVTWKSTLCDVLTCHTASGPYGGSAFLNGKNSDAEDDVQGDVRGARLVILHHQDWQMALAWMSIRRDVTKRYPFLSILQVSR